MSEQSRPIAYARLFSDFTVRPIYSLSPEDISDYVTMCDLGFLDNVSDDTFVIGPLYQLGDAQLFVTGKAKTHEEMITGALREVEEELGIRPTSLQYLTNHMFIVDGDAGFEPAMTPPTRGRDDKSKRVCVIVLASHDRAVEILESATPHPDALDQDKLSGIVAISGFALRNIIKPMWNDVKSIQNKIFRATNRIKPMDRKLAARQQAIREWYSNRRR